MFPSGAAHDLVAISPEGMVQAKTFGPSDMEAMAAWLEQHQGHDNLYFTVNRLEEGVTDRKARKDHVAAAGALHLDVDDLNGIERIRSFKPKPTAVVFSGGGYQAFWLLESESEELDRVERINRAIARALGGDRQVFRDSAQMKVCEWREAAPNGTVHVKLLPDGMGMTAATLSMTSPRMRLRRRCHLGLARFCRRADARHLAGPSHRSGGFRSRKAGDV